MGGNSSKVDQLNEQITNICTNVMMQYSMECSIDVAHSNVIRADGACDVSGNTQDISSSYNLSCLSKKKTNASLRSDIVSKIMADLQNKQSAMPIQITTAKSVSKLTNIVKSNINSNFSQKRLTKLSADIQTQNEIDCRGSGSVKGNTQKITSEFVGKMSLALADKIMNEVTADNDVTATVKQVQTSAVADIASTLVKGLTSIIGGFTSMVGLLAAAPGLLMFGIIGVIVAFVYMNSGSSGGAAPVK